MDFQTAFLQTASLIDRSNSGSSPLKLLKTLQLADEVDADAKIKAEVISFAAISNAIACLAVLAYLAVVARKLNDSRNHQVHLLEQQKNRSGLERNRHERIKHSLERSQETVGWLAANFITWLFLWGTNANVNYSASALSVFDALSTVFILGAAASVFSKSGVLKPAHPDRIAVIGLPTLIYIALVFFVGAPDAAQPDYPHAFGVFSGALSTLAMCYLAAGLAARYHKGWPLVILGGYALLQPWLTHSLLFPGHWLWKTFLSTSPWTIGDVLFFVTAVTKLVWGGYVCCLVSRPTASSLTPQALIEPQSSECKAITESLRMRHGTTKLGPTLHFSIGLTVILCASYFTRPIIATSAGEVAVSIAVWIRAWSGTIFLFLFAWAILYKGSVDTARGLLQKLPPGLYSLLRLAVKEPTNDESEK